jgi:hypothetical protein
MSSDFDSLILYGKPIKGSADGGSVNRSFIPFFNSIIDKRSKIGDWMKDLI